VPVSIIMIPVIVMMMVMNASAAHCSRGAATANGAHHSTSRVLTRNVSVPLICSS
jgi:hypothetical protein